MELDISTCFQDALRAYLDNIKKIIITLLPYIAALLLSLIVGLVLGGAMMMGGSGAIDAMGDMGDNPAGLAMMGVAAIAGIGIMALSLIGALWSFYGIYQLVVDCFNGNASRIEETNYLAIDWGKFGQYIILGILLALLGIPAMIAAGIGFILLVLPGVFVMGAYATIWSWSYNALFNGDANGPVEALTYAFKLAMADIKSLAIFVAILMGIYIVIFIASFIMAIPAAFIPGAGSLVQIVQVIVSVFVMLLTSRFYFEFKNKFPIAA